MPRDAIVGSVGHRCAGGDGHTIRAHRANLNAAIDAIATALSGTFDSDDGPVETIACGDRMCFRIDGGAVQGGVKRQAPFVYALDDDTTVRFHQRAGRADWAFVYRAGFLSDAKYRR